MKNFTLFIVLAIITVTRGQAEPINTGFVETTTFDSVESYVGLVQERSVAQKSTSSTTGSSAEGVRIGFCPTLEELPITGNSRSNEPVVLHRMVRDNASETFFRAWLMESESTDFKIATFAIKKIVNAHLQYEELDLHEMDLVQLHYIILDSEGNELQQILVPGVVTPIGFVEFNYNYYPLLFPGQKVLSVLEMHLRQGVNTPVRMHRTIAPVVNLLDPTATVAREFNLSLKWEKSRRIECTVLPKHALEMANVGAPLVNQFWLLNGKFTMHVDGQNRETTLPAGAGDWLIAEFILRGTGQGGIWKIAEKCLNATSTVDASSTVIDQMTLVVHGGEEVLSGTRLERGASGALWLFDAHSVTFSATEEVPVEIWVNVSIEPPTGDTTFLNVQDIEVGNYSDELNVMFDNRFISAYELPLSGLRDFESNPSWIPGFVFTH